MQLKEFTEYRSGIPEEALQIIQIGAWKCYLVVDEVFGTRTVDGAAGLSEPAPSRVIVSESRISTRRTYQVSKRLGFGVEATQRMNASL